MRRAYNWNTVRTLYESGKTAYAISQIPNMPTKQGIQKKATKEGWQRLGNSDGCLVAEGATTPAPFRGDERKGIVLAKLRNGATYTLAAGSVGIGDRALRTWRESDSGFAEACETALSAFAIDQVENIRKAGELDWKASAWLAERHPVSRGEFSPPSARNTDNGIQIILHIDRSKREIDYLEDVTPTPPLIEGGGTTTESQTKEEKREAPIVPLTDRKKTGTESEGSGSQGMAITYPVPPPEAKPTPPVTNVTPSSSDTSLLNDPLQRTR